MCTGNARLRGSVRFRIPLITMNVFPFLEWLTVFAVANCTMFVAITSITYSFVSPSLFVPSNGMVLSLAVTCGLFVDDSLEKLGCGHPNLWMKSFTGSAHFTNNVARCDFSIFPESHDYQTVLLYVHINLLTECFLADCRKPTHFISVRFPS